MGKIASRHLTRTNRSSGNQEVTFTSLVEEADETHTVSQDTDDIAVDYPIRRLMYLPFQDRNSSENGLPARESWYNETTTTVVDGTEDRENEEAAHLTVTVHDTSEEEDMSTDVALTIVQELIQLLNHLHTQRSVEADGTIHGGVMFDPEGHPIIAVDNNNSVLRLPDSVAAVHAEAVQPVAPPSYTVSRAMAVNYRNNIPDVTPPPSYSRATAGNFIFIPEIRNRFVEPTEEQQEAISALEDAINDSDSLISLPPPYSTNSQTLGVSPVSRRHLDRTPPPSYRQAINPLRSALMCDHMQRERNPTSILPYTSFADQGQHLY